MGIIILLFFFYLLIVENIYICILKGVLKDFKRYNRWVRYGDNLGQKLSFLSIRSTLGT